MSYLSAMALLQAARDLLDSIPSLALLNATRRQRDVLVKCIDTLLTAQGRQGAAATPINRQAFRHALDSLPLMQREVYFLHRVEARTLEEIAKRLGLPVQEIEALFFAALRGLHAKIYGQQN